MSAEKLREALKLAQIALYECGGALFEANIDRSKTYDDAMDAIDAALAKQPAQVEAVAWRFSPYPAAPKFRVLTEDPDAAQFARDCGVAVTELFTAPPAPAVPDDWLREIQSIAEFAHAACGLPEKDQRNNLSDIADRLCAMLAAEPEVKP